MEYVQQRRAATASSPGPVALLQAEEAEERADGPAGMGQGHAQDGPGGSPGGSRAVAAFSPPSEDLRDREEPGMMVEEEEAAEPGSVEKNKGEEWYSDDEVEFVSETGPG